MLKCLQEDCEGELVAIESVFIEEDRKEFDRHVTHACNICQTLLYEFFENEEVLELPMTEAQQIKVPWEI